MREVDRPSSSEQSANLNRPAATMPSGADAPNQARSVLPKGATPGAVVPSGAAKRRRWYLGIQSKKEAGHVMTEV